MSGTFRLSTGGRIDRAKSLRIAFNGRSLDGFVGDTVASVLLAHGIHHVARSFKYHRPRGMMSHGSDEPSALLAVDRGAGRVDPNNRASVVEATDGLRVSSQNHWPSLQFDVGAINDILSPLFAAGFYYKTFMTPRSFWDRVYEPIIRKAAGLGKAPRAPDPDAYTNQFAHFDLVIVGAGPAGIAHALAASAGADRRVLLVDEGTEPGGSLLHEITATIDGMPAASWLWQACETLAARANVTVLRRTTAFGYYNHNFVGLVERATDHLADPPADLPRECLWQVRAGEIVLATGAHERPLPFPDNDRPGIMLAESVRAFINRWGVAPGRQIVFATAGASAYQAACDAQLAGLDATIVDLRPSKEIGDERKAADALGVKILSGHTVLGSVGNHRVLGLIVAPVDDADNVGNRVTLACDCVGMSGGWTPAVHLFSQSRGKLVFDAALDAFVPGDPAQATKVVGAARGLYDLTACLQEGGSTMVATATPTGFRPFRKLPSDIRRPGKAFVDFQNDVTLKDLALAVREGFESIEHVKRYTTTGMATDQGKTSNMNALGYVASLLDRPIPQVGTTTFRPPYTPVTFGALIGQARHDLFDPVRRTPIDGWAEENGAAFENVALWRRAHYFPRPGEDMHAAVKRETKAVRETVGIFDATTLGKIEVVGPDAAEFMNRIYPNAWLKLEPGRCRYGLMLREDGYVMDDGVVARMASDRFHVTTTTGGAPRVLNHMEDYLQTEWPELNVFLTSTTEQWAVIAVQGPRAREVIAPLVRDIDLAAAAFPHMAVRTGHICGVPTRLFRVSFTGELGFEINVPSDYGRSVWQAIWEQGRRFDMVPYGTETMHVLRAEKGFIIVGQETDGTVTPDDLGLGGLVSKAKPDFVGKRSLVRPDLVAPGRKQLVGLLTTNPNIVLDEGAQIVETADQPIPMTMLGHVTSSYWSPNVGRSIALALVTDGRARLGQALQVTTPAGFTSVQVAAPVFFDTEGSRLNV